MKIGIITSRGGHLYQIMQLDSWWKKHQRFWVTFPGEDVSFFLKKEKKYFGHYPESRNVKNAFLNLFLAFTILKKEQPDLIISCGAGIAPPFFLMAKLFGIKSVFIEPYDFVNYASLSGRVISLFSKNILVQHRKQLSFFKKAKYLGSLLQ